MSENLMNRILTLLAREYEYSQALHSEKEDMMSKLAVDKTTSFDPRRGQRPSLRYTPYRSLSTGRSILETP